VKGFGLRVVPSGLRIFVFQYDDAGGRMRRVTLGHFGALTVEQAREAARRYAVDAAAAKREPGRLDPAAAARQAKANARAAHQAPTVADLATRYLKDRRRKGKRARTLGQYQDMADRLIGPKLGARKIGDVTRRDVAKLHADLEATPYMANRVMTVLRAMFAYAEREELRAPHTNPCTGVEKVPERRRARSLSEADYQALGATLARAEREGLPIPEHLPTPAERVRLAKTQAKGTSRVPEAPAPWDPRLPALFRFLALSGWREGEARALRWSDVDLGRAVAVLQETKSGRSTRPLGAAAVHLLRGLPRELGSPYVFPGRPARQRADGTPGPATHRSNVRRPWAVVRHAAGLAGGDESAEAAAARLHDLRHSFTTVARGLGYGDHVIAALIGHTVRAG
jgi:integrase